MSHEHPHNPSRHSIGGYNGSWGIGLGGVEMGILRFLCRVGLHNWSTFRVGSSLSAGFMTETPVSQICRWCGDTQHYNVVMLGATPKLSKDSAIWKKYREKRGDGYVAD